MHVLTAVVGFWTVELLKLQAYGANFLPKLKHTKHVLQMPYDPLTNTVWFANVPIKRIHNIFLTHHA